MNLLWIKASHFIQLQLILLMTSLLQLIHIYNNILLNENHDNCLTKIQQLLILPTLEDVFEIPVITMYIS